MRITQYKTTIIVRTATSACVINEDNRSCHSYDSVLCVFNEFITPANAAKIIKQSSYCNAVIAFKLEYTVISINFNNNVEKIEDNYSNGWHPFE